MKGWINRLIDRYPGASGSSAQRIWPFANSGERERRRFRPSKVSGELDQVAVCDDDGERLLARTEELLVAILDTQEAILRALQPGGPMPGSAGNGLSVGRERARRGL